MKENRVALYNIELLNRSVNLYIKNKQVYVYAYSLEIIQKYNPEKNIISYPYHFKGNVFEETTPVERSILSYNKDTYELEGQTVSASDGTFILPTTTSGCHFLACLDATSTPDYNDLVIAQMYPVCSGIQI